MKKHRTPRLRHRSLFVEGLESRAMLAGNVTAAVRGGTLFVTGDNLDNQVVIQQTGTNQFSVVGVTASATTVNGKAEGIAFTGNGVRNFEINLRGGNDTLGISNDLAYLDALAAELAAGPGAPLTPPATTATALSLRGYANIRGAAGNDAIAVNLVAGGSIFVDANAGSDAVVVEGSTAASLVVNSDSGNQQTDAADYVRIRDVTTRGALVVNTWAGDDNVLLTDDTALVMVLNTGVGATTGSATDNDTLAAARLVASANVVIHTLAGADSVTVTDVDAGFFLAAGGSGNDTMGFAYLDGRNATLLGEGGNDSITVDDTINAEDPATPVVVDDTNNTEVTGLLLIDAGSGNDTVNVNGDVAFNPEIRNLTIVTLAGNDIVSLSNLTLSGNATIDLGTGNDSLTMDTVAASGFIHAFLGSGDDDVTITNTTAAGSSRARFFGGLGADTFTDGGGNGVRGTDYFLFDIETVLP